MSFAKLRRRQRCSPTGLVNVGIHCRIRSRQTGNSQVPPGIEKGADLLQPGRQAIIEATWRLEVLL
jgi:hypothetical protein